MRLEDIIVGTSGWDFKDWVGRFYPFRLSHKQWLEYYAARFQVGEVNATYYGLLPTSSFENMAKKTPDNFDWFVKVHQDVTHTRKEPEQSLKELLTALLPLKESGKLKGLLAQFPFAFQYSESNMNYLKWIADTIVDIPLCVEYRHESWIRDDVVEMMQNQGMIWVTPDEPQIKSLMPYKLNITSGIGYIRMHGRNQNTWFNPEVGDRYDYRYSKEELTQFFESLFKIEKPIKKVYVLFNNCYKAKAVDNARELQEWLDKPDSTNDDVSLFGERM